MKVYDIDGPLFFTSANRLVKLLDPSRDPEEPTASIRGQSGVAPGHRNLERRRNAAKWETRRQLGLPQNGWTPKEVNFCVGFQFCQPTKKGTK